MHALRERPPAGTIPAQFLALSPRTKHAIAVDASRSRLYLFANSATGLRLVSDYYISVGKAGTDKLVEGDVKAGSLTVAAGSRMRGQVAFGWDEKAVKAAGLASAGGGSAA